MRGKHKRNTYSKLWKAVNTSTLRCTNRYFTARTTWILTGRRRRLTEPLTLLLKKYLRPKAVPWDSFTIGELRALWTSSEWNLNLRLLYTLNSIARTRRYGRFIQR